VAPLWYVRTSGTSLLSNDANADFPTGVELADDTTALLIY